MAIEEVRQAIVELERLGILEKTGQYLEGQPVLSLTDLGRRLSDDHPALLASILERGSFGEKT